MDYILIFILGLIIGSFLNVCIYRIPENKSIIWPSSSCIYCGEKLKFYHLLPVLSYLFLRGKCSYCQKKISVLYPLIEILTGILFTLVYYKFGLGLNFIKYSFLFSLLLIISFIDLKTQIIPDGLIISGLLSGIIFLFIDEVFLENFSGALLGGGILFLIALLSRGGMGGGDIKLMFVIGLFTGWQKVLVNLFLAFVAGGIIGLVLLLIGKKGRKDPVPFGPFLSLGAVLAVLFGQELIFYYINIFL